MGNLWIFLIMMVILAPLVYFWVEAIDYMKENHPDYKGEDFLNWGNESAPWEEEKPKKKK